MEVTPTTLRKHYGCEAKHADRPMTDHEWTDHLLEHISIRARTSGRIRFFINIKGDEVMHDCLRREVSKLTGARLMSYNYQTRTALVVFATNELNEVDVTLAIMKAVQAFGRKHGDCEVGDLHNHESPLIVGEQDHDYDLDHDHKHDGEEEEKCGHDHSSMMTQKDVRREITKLGITGVMLGFFVWRRLRGVAPLAAGGPMGVVGALTTIVAGYPIFRGGLKTLGKGKKLTDDTLISIAVAATLVMRENITGLSVVWLINLGRLLEAMTLRRSREEIKRLLELAPDEAWLIPNEGATPVRVDTDEVEIGNIIRVFKADQVPLDGIITRGEASVIESHLNGEPLPKLKKQGEKVYAGSILDSGEIDIQVETLVNETVIAKIVHEIERLRDTKAPIEKVGTKFATKFVPISLGISAGVFVLTGDWRRAITSLVIACPCAAGLATPTAVSAGIGQSAKRGILVKGGTHLETAAKIDAVVFDKTGTLTHGMPEVVETFIDNGMDELELLAMVAAVEKYSTHPLGRVLVNHAETRRAPTVEVEDYSLLEGRGVTGRVNGSDVLIGNAKFLRAEGVEIEDAKLQKVIASRPVTTVAVAVDGKFAALYLLEDRLRENAKSTLKQLSELGVKKVVILSGDRHEVVEYVGSQLGVDVAKGDMLPQDKFEYVEQLKADGYKVAMIGDGVNDAQALASADLSMAMAGSQCDLAIDVADITIARDDIQLVVPAMKIARETLRTIKTNFAASIGVNGIGLVIGASGNLSPLMAAVVHNLSTLAVVGNSMALSTRLKLKSV